MKKWKQPLALLLMVLMLCSTMPLMVVAAKETFVTVNDENEEECALPSKKQGDIIEFGTYPQTRVTDSNLIAKLNSLAQSKDWNSYNYYKGTGNQNDGKMTASDFMEYCDLSYEGKKYRGVFISYYRPDTTGGKLRVDDGYQKANGYYYVSTYWFRWDPLKWIVLDPTSGMVLCQRIIDSQPFCNQVFYVSNRFQGADWYQSAYYDYDFYYPIPNEHIDDPYANTWGSSSMRYFLSGSGNNNSFYNLAFSEEEKKSIFFTELDNTVNGANSHINWKYDSYNTQDPIFLLSLLDFYTKSYGLRPAQGVTPDAICVSQGTDYAKSQGLKVCSDSSSSFYGCSDWYLRTPSRNIHGCNVCFVGYDGDFTDEYNNANFTYFGVRPAMRIRECSHDWQLSETNGVDCAICGEKYWFEFGKDNIGFTNNDHGTLHVSYKAYLYRNPSFGIDLFSLGTQLHYDLWGYKGACMGFALMNSAFQNGMSTLDFGANTPFELKKENEKLSDAINLLTLSQASLCTLYLESYNEDCDLKHIVDLAKSVKQGDFLPVVSFSVPNWGVHAVNIIGLIQDENGDYMIIVNDCNHLHHPSVIHISKDYNYATFHTINEKKIEKENIYDYDNIGKISTVNFVITDSSLTIDKLSGLRLDPLNLYSTANKKQYNKNLDNGTIFVNEDEQETEFRRNHTLLVFEDTASLRLSSQGGKNILINNGVVQASSLKIISDNHIAGSSLSCLIFENDGDTYSCDCNTGGLLLFNNDGKIGAVDVMSKANVRYSISDESFSITPQETNTKYSLSFYKDDLIPNTDVIGVQLDGAISKPMTVSSNQNGAAVSCNEISEQTLLLHKKDEDFSSQEYDVSNCENVVDIYPDENGEAVVSEKEPEQAIKIHNYTPSHTVDYRTTITFSADEIQYPVLGAQIHWFIDGQDTGASDTYTVKEAKKGFTVQAKYVKEGKVLAESEIETVKVNAGFFARLKAFFRALFGRLPKVVQEYLGVEIIDKMLP